MSNKRKGKLDDLGRRRDACPSLVHGRANSPAEGSGVKIRIRYRILNAPSGVVSGGGVDQAYDGWRVASEFEFQQWVENGYSFKPPEFRQYADTVL
jgi:glutamate dehydrogenase/leucine dehydrogenase